MDRSEAMSKQNNLPQVVIPFACGLVFAAGLIISQMINPAKVLNFLDIAGNWDPTLAFVMGGAILVTMPLFRLVLKAPHPLFAGKFYLPSRRDIDVRLIGGATLFGIGWGIAGLCPGPAITALASGLLPVVAFLIAMTAGALIYKWLFE
jgi:uncharacterized membrane protein YedE/YeeE